MTSVVRFEEWQEPTGTTAATVDGSGNVAFSGTITQGGVLMPSASTLNAIGTWTTYTPEWSAQGTSPVLNDGVLVGQYSLINDVVVYQFFLTIASTTTFGTGYWKFSLPVTSETPFRAYARIGSGTAFDASTATHRALVPIYENLSTTHLMVAADQSVGAPDVNSAVPFSWSTSDQLSVTVIYRAAA